MLDMETIRAMLTGQAEAIDAALGAQAPAFWQEVAAITRHLDPTSDPQAQAEAVGRLEELGRRYPAVWELISPLSSQPGPGQSKKGGEPTMTTTPVPPAKPEKPSLETWLTALREGVTGCLGVLIVLTTLALVLATFLLMLLRPTANLEPFQAILVMLNGMTGAVLGYYFGRMPAEAQASKADKARAAAEQKVAEVRAGLQELDRELSQAVVVTRKTPAEARVDQVQACIRRLLDETVK